MDRMLFNNRLKHLYEKYFQLTKTVLKISALILSEASTNIYILFFSPFSYLQYKTVSFLQVH